MSSNKFRATSFLLALSVTFAGLTVGWVNAARADEPGQLVDCKSRPLDNGRPGETVRECKVVRTNERSDGRTHSAPARIGYTTVTHIGR